MKQTPKAPKTKMTAISASETLRGRPVTSDNPMLGRLIALSEAPGSHLREGIPMHVAKDAKSFRSPEPRFESDKFDLRSSYGLFALTNGSSEWRELERDACYTRLREGRRGLIGHPCSKLVTFCRSFQTNKRYGSAVK